MLERDQSLDDYRQTIGRATSLLDQLKDDVPDDTELEALVTDARGCAARLGQDRRGADHHAMEAGKRLRAMKETKSSPGRGPPTTRMTAASTALHKALNDKRDEAADAVVDVHPHARHHAHRRRRARSSSASLAFLIGLQAWVLSPADATCARTCSGRPGARSPDTDPAGRATRAARRRHRRRAPATRPRPRDRRGAGRQGGTRAGRSPRRCHAGRARRSPADARRGPRGRRVEPVGRGRDGRRLVGRRRPARTASSRSSWPT